LGAYESGQIEHPQIVMNKFIRLMKEDKHIEIEVLEHEAVPIGDCWLFLIKCSTPWLDKNLPSFISHQGLGNDKEGKYK